MQICSPDVPLGAAIGAAAVQNAEGLPPHISMTHVDFIALQLRARQGPSKDLGGFAGPGFFARKGSLHWQQPHSPQASTQAALHAVWVMEGGSQHLVSAANAQNWRTSSGKLLDQSFQAALRYMNNHRLSRWLLI